MSAFKIGSRVKVANGFMDPNGTLIPPAATAEILNVHSSGAMLEVVAKWKLGNGKIAEWQGHAAKSEFVAGRGRLLMPGEAPPKKGEQFGVTGVNNDYAKQRKQGLRPSLPTSPLAAALAAGGVVILDEVDAMTEQEYAELHPAAPSTTTPPAMTTVAAPNFAQLDARQLPYLGHPCPTSGCTGVYVEVKGQSVDKDGNPYPWALCKCSESCGARIDRRGDLKDAPIDRKLKHKLPPAGTVNIPLVPATPAALAALTGAPVSPAVAATAATPAPAPAAPTKPADGAATVSKSGKVKPATAAQMGLTCLCFPLTKASKLMDDVRVMGGQGSEMTFSLRKIKSWATAAVAFFNAGAPTDDAVAAGFRLVAFDREVAESRGKLEQLFQSHFGYRPNDPKLMRHPAVQDDAIIGMALAAHLNLWISGPTGCGKTHSVITKLDKMGREYIRVQGGEDITRESLVGFPSILHGNSGFQAGPLVVAMERGCAFVLDEIDKLRDAPLSEIAAVLEGNPLVLLDDGGRRVLPADGFCIIATANTVGRGEGNAYGGTRAVNEALRDRFIFLGAEYDTPRDTQITGAHLNSLGATFV